MLNQLERDRLRAKRKADRMNAKDASAIPLFAEQLEQRSAEGEYWRLRQMWADRQGGQEGAYLAGVDWKVNLWIVRSLARRVMSADDFEIADNRKFTGDLLTYWRYVLIGEKRMVLSWQRISKGWKALHLPRQGQEEALVYVEQVEMREGLVWPPEGWKAPLTEAEYDELTTTPEPRDLETALEIKLGMNTCPGEHPVLT